MGFVYNICAQFTLYYCSQVAQLPAEKSDIFIQYLQDNIPPGVSLHMELVKKSNSFELLYFRVQYDHFYAVYVSINWQT